MSNTAYRSEQPFTAYRIGSSNHPLLDGAGAAASNDARWNSAGRWIIYAAEHYATALLEKAAQLNSVKIPRILVFVQIDIPSGIDIEEVRPEDLHWQAEDKTASQQFGDDWYDSQRSLILIVPSMAAPGLERNILINQRHPEFGRIQAGPVQPVRCHPRLLV